MGAELLAPFAKWGAVLAGLGALVFLIRRSGANRAEFKRIKADVKAHEEQAKKRTRVRETAGDRRARLLRRRARRDRMRND